MLNLARYDVVFGAKSVDMSRGWGGKTARESVQILKHISE